MADEDTVSLMVLPPLVPDLPPQILMASGGTWRDMTPAGAVRNELLTMSQLREQIDRLLGLVMQEVEEGTTHSARSGRLKSEFMQLYEILPQGVRELLSVKSQQSPGAAAGPPTLLLHLHPQSEWVPWEMLHDGDNYLGLKWQLARLPIVPKNINPSRQQPRQVQSIFSLLGKNVFEETEADLRQLWQTTFGGRPQEQRFPPDANSNYPDVDVVTNSRDADILHITCHGGLKNEEGEFVWTLDHRSKSALTFHITSRIVSSLSLRARPLVFGNACASVRGGGGVGVGPRGLIPGFGASFFSQGALNFVGTFAPVSKSVAVEFARTFYGHLLGLGGQPGESVGRALWRTKTEFYGRDIPAQPDKPDLSYLFYCLYGLPDTTYQV